MRDPLQQLCQQLKCGAVHGTGGGTSRLGGLPSSPFLISCTKVLEQLIMRKPLV